MVFWIKMYMFASWLVICDGADKKSAITLSRVQMQIAIRLICWIFNLNWIELGTRTVSTIGQDIGERSTWNAGNSAMDWTNTETTTITRRMSHITTHCIRLQAKKVEGVLDAGTIRKWSEVSAHHIFDN